MTIQEITSFLELWAPLSLQEGYDNSGLLIGDGSVDCSGALCCLDVTEEVLMEAEKNNCNLIIAHHPPIFKGLKKLNGKNMVERIVIKSIQKGLAIYAIHTNLDNVLSGVNGRIAQRIGLKALEILSPKPGLLKKMVSFVPQSHLQKVRDALFEAGGGAVGPYSQCSFRQEGVGSFLGNLETTPFVGEVGVFTEVPEIRLELLFPSYLQSKMIEVLKREHPYEEVAYDVFSLENDHPEFGSGVLGRLPDPLKQNDFLQLLKETMCLKLIRHTAVSDLKIETVAVCGGAGSFLIPNALAAKADAFITADLKYHEFFQPEGRLLLCDIGHFESERFTIELLADILQEKFPTFAVLKSGLLTNPVHYYF